jgi:Sulfotransferase domain
MRCFRKIRSVPMIDDGIPKGGPAAARKLKVFGIGLSRTGTTSLTDALKLLGYRSIHFPHDSETMREIIGYLRAPEAELRLTILNEVDALTDTPITTTFRALDRAYAGSKCILTERDESAWLASCERYWAEVLMPLMATRDKDTVAYIEAVNIATYGTHYFEPGHFSATLRRHRHIVREYFRSRPDDLLVVDLSEGSAWETVCHFLDETVPNVPFPHSNRLLTGKES